MEYLAYIRALLSLLPHYGIVAFVSMHQDVWSRYSGGSGAPAWTLTATGFNLNALEETGAAWLKGVKGGPTEAERRADGKVWTEGEVHADFIRVSYVSRSLVTKLMCCAERRGLLRLPLPLRGHTKCVHWLILHAMLLTDDLDSRGRTMPLRVFIEKGPGVREDEPVMRWDSS